ncbi:hypothetical protein Raf01_94620 [Rugosimonospora africana]|uniref:Uncharacterized protein n=1 Tax=Rugosimonospora africana TaxID=556532 RepID=A0A8J3R4Q6_9ACTN|nr:hypothetical protein Raf01_94620 [Rugosimonospora africana]
MLRAAMGQLFDDLVAEGVKTDDLHRVGELLQDPRVTVNGHVVVSVRARRPQAQEIR